MIVVANYKMNLNLKNYKIILKKLNNIQVKDTKLVLCPPFVYLPFFEKNKSWYEIGGQDVSANIVGKCTGQVSANMLKDFNVTHCIVGHSDRREFETNEKIANKVEQLVNNGIIPIICVGEKEKNGEDNLIIEQVRTALSKIKKDAKFYIAYEPVWAIGSGDIATNSYINKKVAIIKKEMKKLGFNQPILYGGSVDEENCQHLKKCNIAGFLVGGLSLNTDKFIDLLRGV